MKDICNTCFEEVPIEQLVKNSKQAKGYLKLCKKCKRSKGKESRSKDRKVYKRAKRQMDWDGDWLGPDAVYL